MLVEVERVEVPGVVLTEPVRTVLLVRLTLSVEVRVEEPVDTLPVLTREPVDTPVEIVLELSVVTVTVRPVEVEVPRLPVVTVVPLSAVRLPVVTVVLPGVREPVVTVELVPAVREPVVVALTGVREPAAGVVVVAVREPEVVAFAGVRLPDTVDSLREPLLVLAGVRESEETLSAARVPNCSREVAVCATRVPVDASRVEANS